MRRYVILSGIIGGVIGSMLTALLVAPVTARSDKFAKIECTRLAVVDAKGNERIILSTNISDGYDDRSIADDNTVRIIGNEDSAMIAAEGKGLESAVLSVGAYGTPLVAATDKDGVALASLSTNEHGGVVYIEGNDGESVFFRIIEQGGEITLSKGITSPAVTAFHVDEHGGDVVAYDNGGEPAVSLGVRERRGHVYTYGRGKGAAAMGINQYGNGAVSAWDKNGNKR